MLSESAMPPCMVTIRRNLAAGAPVPHVARLAFASFLLKMGTEPAHVVDSYAKAPNFDRGKTVRIVADLAKKGSMPYSCANMRLHGICRAGMPEALCGSIRNPVSYGRIRGGIWGETTPATMAEESVVEVVCQCGKSLGLARGHGGALAVHSRHWWTFPDPVGDREHLIFKEV